MMISDGTYAISSTCLQDALNELVGYIEKMQSDYVDLLLLSSVTPGSSVSVYKMSYEDYCELPYTSRL